MAKRTMAQGLSHRTMAASTDRLELTAAVTAAVSITVRTRASPPCHWMAAVTENTLRASATRMATRMASQEWGAVGGSPLLRVWKMKRATAVSAAKELRLKASLRGVWRLIRVR